MDGTFPMDLVAPRLFLGAAPTSLNHFQSVRERGVDAILTLQTEAEAARQGLLPEVASRVASSLGMSMHRMPIPDLDPASLRRLIDNAVLLLDDLLGGGRHVFLHCAAGLNRSPTVAAAWIAWRRDLEAAAACLLVRQSHPSVPDVEAVHRFLQRVRKT